MTSFDKELCHKIKLGDESAFEYVYKSYYALLCCYAYDLVKNTDLAEEIVQELLIKIWENRDKLVITISLKSYLYRSVHNQCINIIKHNQVTNNLAHKYSEDLRLNADLTMISDEEFTLEDYLYDGLEKDIEKAVETLPDQCRVIFQMSRFGMLSYKAIAKELKISENTVKTQIRRALEKLRADIARKIEDHLKSVNI